MSKELKGIIPVLVTPFTEEGLLDEKSWEKEVAFAIASGVHGVAIPGQVSEFWKLTFEERQRITDIAVRTAAGKIPVVIGVAAPNGRVAAQLAAYANDAGADAVFATPPIFGATDDATVQEYYQTMGEAIKIPIVLMDAGIPMSVGLMVRLGREIENVQYVKDEAQVTGQKISQILAESNGQLKCLSGLGGKTVLDDLARGAVGCMPGAVLMRELAQVYELFQAGKLSEARQLFNRVVPLINFRGQFSLPVTKEVLRRQGLFAASYIRRPTGPMLDEQDLKELTAIMESIGL